MSGDSPLLTWSIPSDDSTKTILQDSRIRDGWSQPHVGVIWGNCGTPFPQGLTETGPDRKRKTNSGPLDHALPCYHLLCSSRWVINDHWSMIMVVIMDQGEHLLGRSRWVIMVSLNWIGAKPAWSCFHVTIACGAFGSLVQSFHFTISRLVGISCLYL